MTLSAGPSPMPACVNRPHVLAELNHMFERYEVALIHNNVDVLDELLWNSPHTLRYGAKEILTGYAEIQAFRKARPSAGINRTIVERHVMSFGDDCGVTNLSFRREGEPRMGRQSQTWARFAEGWRVVSAHVSWMDL